MYLIDTIQATPSSYQIKISTHTVTTPTELHHIVEKNTTQNVSTEGGTHLNKNNNKSTESNIVLTTVTDKGNSPRYSLNITNISK